MKQKLRVFLTLLLCAVASVGWGQTTYKLEQVTEVEAGGLYVFEQDGYVMNNTCASSALQTINNYSTTGLTGSETYVWTLEGSTSAGFSMYNVSLTTVNKYLNNASSTTVSLGNKDNTKTLWVFNFQDNNTVVIQNSKNSNRFLGYTSGTSHAYKAYAESNLSSGTYPHAIKVFKLVEEEISTTTVALPTFSPAAGTYVGTQSVTISTTTAGATIHYTTDGTDPTDGSTEYTAPINVATNTTIKAIAVKEGMDNSAVATATYTIVTLEHAGTAEDPYTVADARNAIDANTGVTDVYATGIVSEIVTAYSSQYSNITFDLVDEEGNSETVQAYRCTGEEAANVQVGDVVVVKGNLTKYNTTYEFAQGCEIVSRTSSSTQVAAGLAFSSTSVSADLSDLASFTAPTLENPNNLPVIYTSSNTEVATVAEDGTVTIKAEGKTTITASSEETEQYLAGTASYTLTVTNSNKQLVTVDADGNITFDLSDNGWGFPTAKQVDEGSYSSDGYTIKVAGTTGEGFYFYNDAKALLMGKNGAYLSLPAFDMPVEKIDVVGKDGASSSVVQNIFVGETAVSTATTGAKGTNTYEIAEDYKAAGNVYTLKVTSAHNTQITKIKVYKGTIDERANAEIAFSTESLTITQGKDYTAPTFSNPNNVAVTFATDNADVASWDNGLVLGTATGTAVITATFDGNESYKPATAMLTVTVKEDLNFVDVVEGCGIYQKITSASDLEAGKRYLIVYENGDKAVIYNGQNGTNSYAGKVDGDISGNKIDNTSVNAASIVLQRAGSNNWYLMDGDNFLYWNSGNTLEWTEKVAESDTWTIDVENGQIINAEETTRRLQYNTGSPRFACYTGTQKDVVLYKELMEAPQPEIITVSVNALATDGNKYYSTLYYSDKNLKIPAGITASGVSLNGTKLVKGAALAEGDVIGKGNAVLLTADEAKGYEFTVVADTEVDATISWDDNMLRGNDENATTEGGDVYYQLSRNANGDANSIGFYWGAPDGGTFTNKGHRAYLAVPAEQAKGITGFTFGDMTDGIEAIDNSQSATDKIYNLSGQRVNKVQKGIYIVNGKKVVVK